MNSSHRWIRWKWAEKYRIDNDWQLARSAAAPVSPADRTEDDRNEAATVLTTVTSQVKGLLPSRVSKLGRYCYYCYYYYYYYYYYY